MASAWELWQQQDSRADGDASAATMPNGIQGSGDDLFDLLDEADAHAHDTPAMQGGEEASEALGVPGAPVQSAQAVASTPVVRTSLHAVSPVQTAHAAGRPGLQAMSPQQPPASHAVDCSEGAEAHMQPQLLAAMQTSMQLPAHDHGGLPSADCTLPAHRGYSPGHAASLMRLRAESASGSSQASSAAGAGAVQQVDQPPDIALAAVQTSPRGSSADVHAVTGPSWSSAALQQPSATSLHESQTPGEAERELQSDAGGVLGQAAADAQRTPVQASALPAGSWQRHEPGSAGVAAAQLASTVPWPGSDDGSAAAAQAAAAAGPPAPLPAPARDAQEAAEATESRRSFVTLSGPPSGYAALLTDPSLQYDAATASPMRLTQQSAHSSDRDASAPLPVSSPPPASAAGSERAEWSAPSLSEALHSAEHAVQQTPAPADSPAGAVRPLHAVGSSARSATREPSSPQPAGSSDPAPAATQDANRSRGRGLFGLLGRRRNNTDGAAPDSGAQTPVARGAVASPLLQFAKDLAAGTAVATGAHTADVTAGDVARELLRLEALRMQDAAQRDTMSQQLEQLQAEAEHTAGELRTVQQDAQAAQEQSAAATQDLSSLHALFVQALQDIVVLRTQQSQPRCVHQVVTSGCWVLGAGCHLAC